MKTPASDIPQGVMTPRTLMVLRLDLAGLLATDGKEARRVWVGWSPLDPVAIGDWASDWGLRIVLPRFPRKLHEPMASVEDRLARAIGEAFERLLHAAPIPAPRIILGGADFLTWGGDTGTLFATEGQCAYRADLDRHIAALSNHQRLELTGCEEIAYLAGP